jgi:hypothetical protein
MKASHGGMLTELVPDACGRWIDMRDLGDVLEHERACDGTPARPPHVRQLAVAVDSLVPFPCPGIPEPRRAM